MKKTRTQLKRTLQKNEAGARRRMNARAGSTMVVTTRSAGGTKNGIVLASPPTRLQYTAAHQIAHFIRAKMAPIRVPPVTVRDGAGRIIAQIIVNPVTGSRHRLPVLPT